LSSFLGFGVSYNDLFETDPVSFTKTVCPYISYYKSNTSTDYPTVCDKIKLIPYSEFQYQKYLNYMTNVFDPELFVFLKDLQPKDITTETLTILSNYNYPHKILQKLTVFGNIGVDPPKFNAIYKKIKGNYGIVVYSNFYNQGILPFSQFLKDKGINCTILKKGISDTTFNRIITDFKNKKIKVLLIHPDYTEGYTIWGARQLHLLEPISSFAKSVQIKGRVVRYRTHSHLPKNERSVDIYTWGMDSSSFIESFRSMIMFYKHWIRYFVKDISYNLVPNKLPGVIQSPDELILSQNKNMNFVQKLIETHCHI
jgi:hypothetical protein